VSLLFRSVATPRRSRLLPYTTLFRSGQDEGEEKFRPRVNEGEDRRGDDPGGRQGDGDHFQHLPSAASVDPRGVLELHRHLPEIRSEEHTSELQSRENLVCRLLLEKKK